MQITNLFRMVLSLISLLFLSQTAFAQTLLSQGKPVVVSSTQGGFPGNAAVDGNSTSRWASNYNDSEWIYVDLGATSSISKVVLNWEAAYGKSYQIQTSNDALSWTTISSVSSGVGGTETLNVSGSGRYVRMNGQIRGTGWGYSLFEFQVYGGGASSQSSVSSAPVSSSKPSSSVASSVSSVAGILLSQNQPTVVSSTQQPFTSNMAVDGSASGNSRWASAYSDAEWIYVDLGASASISKVVLKWEAAYGKSYQIQTSSNGTSWTTVYSTTMGVGGIETINLSASGRYVKMNGLLRGTGYGYSLFEFQVYGTVGGATSSIASSQSSAISSASSVSSVKSSSSVVSSVVSSSSVATSSSSSSSVPAVCSTLPSVPAGLAASGITTTSLMLSWGASNPGANCAVTKYNVYRSGSLVASPFSLNTVVSGLSSGTSYSFTVAAVNSFGASAQSAPLVVSTLVNSGAPNFGSNVLIFDPSMNTADIQAQINNIYTIQQNNQFGTPRTAIMFKPGNYNVDIPVGFFTYVMGLGSVPSQVSVTSIHSDAILPNGNATQNFWRSVENFTVTTGAQTRWAVSQAAPFRRMSVPNGNVILSDNYGWCSGGWFADSKIGFDVTAWSQQQWISRNSEWGSWSGSLWNMVFVGIPNHLPGGTWPTDAVTTVAATPVVREKPFLYLNGSNYEVFVPSLKTNSQGISWANGIGAGTSVSLEQFYIARAGIDNAATINAALVSGKHLLLTPGVYDLTDSIQVTRANTIVLGIGFATLHPTTGKPALTVADVDGVTVAHLMVDAGKVNSPVLVQIGDKGSTASHVSNPTEVIDVFIRVGGNGVALATVAMEVNSNDTIVDHVWLWRADHGDGAGWDSNPSLNGLVVNGNNVTAYGLFVEHFQQYQVLWNGNNGRTYFYQSEIPYDPPTQTQWTSAPGVNGWASYKVADTVTSHEAWGLGVYAVFTYPNVFLSRAIEVPNTPNVKFHHMTTVNLTANGSIQHVINDVGIATTPGVATNTPRVGDYPQN